MLFRSIEVLADGAERYLAVTGRAAAMAQTPGQSFEVSAFAGMPDEIRLRLLIRAINRFGTEGPVELGKAEALLAALDRTFAGIAGGGGAVRGTLKQTLAGALVSVGKGRVRITPAPARGRR